MTETINSSMEPFAEELIKAFPKQPVEQFATVSIAISLKRIADKLDGLSPHGHELDDVMFNAGRSFESGRRHG